MKHPAEDLAIEYEIFTKQTFHGCLINERNYDAQQRGIATWYDNAKH